MNAIIDFFTSIIDILVSLVQLLITLVDSVLWFVTNLPQLVSGITASFAYTPSFLMPFLMASVSLMVVFAIIRLL